MLLCHLFTIKNSIMKIRFLFSIDKVKNSICGKECGYIINHPDIFNPLNFIFLKASKVSILIFIYDITILLFFISTSLTYIFPH